jgi:single-strand DNA-binding protein
VIASGRLRQRSFETSNGDRRTVLELEVDEIGPSLRFATAKVTVHRSDNTTSSSRPPGSEHYDDEPPF